MKVKKVNTSGYHPQTDGFLRTLIQIVSLYVEKHGRDWDHYLPYLLYPTVFPLKTLYVRAHSICSMAEIPDNPLTKFYPVLQLRM